MSRFDWLLLDDTQKKRWFDKKLASSKSFAAFASLGSMVEGWTLIAPKIPYQNLSELSPDEASELAEFVSLVKTKLSVFSNEIYEFEHGAAKNPLVGCGVDHAHLHLVPFKRNLTRRFLESEDVVWKQLNSVEPYFELPEKMDYLYFRTPDGKSYVSSSWEPTSQWFRKRIAEELDTPASWDYNKFPNFKNIETTINRIAG